MHRSLAVTMELFVLLEGLMRGKGGWKSALEECGELCVIIITIGRLLLPELCADSWGLKWICQELVSLNKFKMADYTGPSETLQGWYGL